MKNKFEFYVEILQMGVLKFFTGAVAQPIRAFHLQVGHATVTSAVVICFAAVTIGLSWTYMIHDLNAPKVAAEVAQIEANTRRLNLDNAKKAETISMVPVATWRMMAINATSDGVTFTFPAHAIASRWVVSWRTIPRDGTPPLTGIIGRTIDQPGQTVTITVLLEEFGPAWVSGSRLMFQATQFLEDSREQRFAGVSRMIMIP